MSLSFVSVLTLLAGFNRGHLDCKITTRTIL